MDLTAGFNGLGKDNCKTRRETFQFRDLVPLILNNWRYFSERAWQELIDEYTSRMNKSMHPAEGLQLIVWYM